jgi:hypothetical protein
MSTTVITILSIIFAILSIKTFLIAKKLNNLILEVDKHLADVQSKIYLLSSSVKIISDTLAKVVEDTFTQLKGEKIKEASDKFDRINEITKTQLDLFASTQLPSSSPSHSKYKNGIVGELKKLEEEKLEIMKSLLDEGIDPEVGVLDEDGNLKSSKMSEIVKKYTDNKETEIPQNKTKTESKSPVNKDAKVISLFGNKGDKDDNPRDPQIH